MIAIAPPSAFLFGIIGSGWQRSNHGGFMFAVMEIQQPWLAMHDQGSQPSTPSPLLAACFTGAS